MRKTQVNNATSKETGGKDCEWAVFDVEIRVGEEGQVQL